MIENITFLHSNWILPVGISAIVLWFIFIWKEWAHVGKSRFWIRITIAFLAIIALAFIALKPAVPILGKNTKVVILTTNYNKNQLDSLQKTHKKLKTVEYEANQPIFKNIHTSDAVFVLGDGIEPFDFWQLENHEVIYIKGDTPSGVIRFRYDQKSVVGEQFNLEGLYQHPIKGNRLILEEPGGNAIDSIMLSSETKQSFRLSTDLKVIGRYTFSLVEKDSLGNIHSRDPIPIKVTDRTYLKIWIVNSFPTFETKYLKNYLAENGHQVVVKSRITRGRFKFEYFNTDRIPVGAFSEKNLEPFDLVILDANTAKSLGRGSRIALEKSIKQHGLGLFIQPDDDFFRFRKDEVAFNFVRGKTTEMRLQNTPNSKLATYPFLFKDEFRLQTIHRNTSGAIVSAHKYLGKGSVGTTILQNTYELLLNGNTKEYQQLWSEIINTIGKKERAAVSWDENNILVTKDQPYTFRLRTAISEPEVTANTGYRIALRSDIDISNLWYGTTYPKKLGWNKVVVAQDTTAVLDYFVTDTTTWKSSSVYDKINSNRKYFSESSKITTKQFSPLAPINLTWVYILFLFCMGYLWFAPKIEKA